MDSLRIKRLRPDAILPAYATHGAAGLDLSVATDTPIEIEPGGILRVPTGIAVALPKGYEGQVRPRSGLAARHGITLLNSPGTIDEDYRGEIQVILVHHGKERHVFHHGDRIAQLVIAPVARVSLVEAEELDETPRGAGGFGSTGFGPQRT